MGLCDYLQFLDARDELWLTATAGAVLDFNAEHALQAPHPVHRHMPGRRLLVLPGLAGFDSCSPPDQSMMPMVICVPVNRRSAWHSGAGTVILPARSPTIQDRSA
jgi:hypothetical protein